MEINTISYVFNSKKPELRRLVVKYGLPPAKNDQDLWKKTNYLVAKFKKEMLKDIAYIHPDRELVLWSTSDDKPEKIADEVVKLSTAVEKTSGACGCSGADGYSNCNGNPNCSCNKKEESSNCNGNPNCSCNNEVKSNIDGTKIKEALKNNMPLVVIGSLLLVGGLIFLGNRQMS